MTDVQSDVRRRLGGGEPTAARPRRATTRALTAGLVDEREREIAERAQRIARRSKPTRVVAARVSIWLRLGELWRARELFVFLVRKEIKVKYKNSVLGFLWSMLNPALTLAVFYVLFTYFLPNGIPNFVIYMFSAMLVWNLFQTAVLSGDQHDRVQRGDRQEGRLPARDPASGRRSAPPSCSSCSSPSCCSCSCSPSGTDPTGARMWLVIPALAAIMVFAAALAVFLSAVNVYLRDTQHLVEVILMAWFWAIPGIYPYSGRVHDDLVKHTDLRASPGPT